MYMLKDEKHKAKYLFFKQEERYSYDCNHHGVFVDGKCDCESGYFGRVCECDESDPEACFRYL